jgi:hypothetical protein
LSREPVAMNAAGLLAAGTFSIPAKRAKNGYEAGGANAQHV